MSILAMFSYIFFRGLHWLVNWLLGLLGYSLPFGWVRPATVIALIFGGIGLLGVVTSTVKGMWQVLYPPVAGYPTPFRNFARSALGKRVLIVGLLAAIAFTVFAFWWPISRLGFWGCVILAYVFAFSNNAWVMSQKKTAPRTFTTSEEAIGAMLRAMGFFVIEQPRTGLPEIDPYLADLDFAVSRDDRTFAMLIQDSAESQRSDLQCVSQVAIAAHALVEGSRRLGGELTSVEPVLVVIGRAQAEELSSFAPSQNVLVIRVQDPAELQPANKDEQVLRTKGAHLFSQLIEQKPPALTTDRPVAGQFSLSSEHAGTAAQS